jgi:hypothetical protein
MRMKSKHKQIEEYLQRVGYITSWQAITLFGLTRLASVISRLRMDGYRISTEIKEENGSRFALYRMHRDAFPTPRISRNSPQTPLPSPSEKIR